MYPVIHCDCIDFRDLSGPQYDPEFQLLDDDEEDNSPNIEAQFDVSIRRLVS